MNIFEKYKNWQYKNTFFLILSLISFFILADTNFVKNIIEQIGTMGYLGAFLTGIFFVSTFTVAPAIVVLYNLAGHLNPFEVAILAGLGAVVGDYIIFRFVKNKVADELAPLFEKIKGGFLGKLFFTPYFAWLSPILGAAIIASPLPDEFGVSILGLSKMRNWQFILLSFILNALGIFIVVTLARSF